jgi:hypothetical protein
MPEIYLSGDQKRCNFTTPESAHSRELPVVSPRITLRVSDWLFPGPGVSV